MIFKLDTNNYEDIHIDIAEEQGNTLNVIIEFCFSIASFFTDLALQLDCDTEQARRLQKVCLSCIKNNINSILDSGILDEDTEEDETISQEDQDKLVNRLIESGLSEDKYTAYYS